MRVGNDSCSKYLLPMDGSCRKDFLTGCIGFSNKGHRLSVERDHIIAICRSDYSTSFLVVGRHHLHSTLHMRVYLRVVYSADFFLCVLQMGSDLSFPMRLAVSLGLIPCRSSIFIITLFCPLCSRGVNVLIEN